MEEAFQPHPNRDSVNLTVTGTTASALIRPVSESNFSNSVRIENNGTGRVFIRFGDSTVTAVAGTGMAMRPDSVEVFTVPRGATHIAAIAAGVGNALNCTLGGGV
jgi:hypothetical protein